MNICEVIINMEELLIKRRDFKREEIQGYINEHVIIIL